MELTQGRGDFLDRMNRMACLGELVPVLTHTSNPTKRKRIRKMKMSLAAKPRSPRLRVSPIAACDSV